MHAIALQILEDIAAAADQGVNTTYLAADCYADGELVGTHYAPLRLALAILDGTRILDLSSEEAGGSVPVDLTSITTVTIKSI